MPKPITLDDELADIRREIKLRQAVYPPQRAGVTDPRKVADLLAAHTHQLACSYATLARLEALVPTQTTLF